MEPSVVERFWSKVGIPTDTDCWPWTGSKHPCGHGQMSSKRNQTPYKAHRVSYMIHKGDIPEGLNINHTCDNASCVNPEHLYAGTQQENMKDVSRRHRNPNTSLTPQQVKDIKDRLTFRERGDIVALSKEYNVSFYIVYDIARKRTYQY